MKLIHYKIIASIHTILAMFFAGLSAYHFMWNDCLKHGLVYLFVGNFIGAVFSWLVVKDLKLKI